MMAPPIEPGMQERNSMPLIPLSFAKSETFRSSAAAPASISFFDINLIWENLDPSLITTPLIPKGLLSACLILLQ